MLTISIYLMRRWILAVIVFILFLTPLIYLNRQFFKAARQMDAIFESYTHIAVDWAQAEYLLNSVYLTDDESRDDLMGKLYGIKQWVTTSELRKIAEFSSPDQTPDHHFKELDLIIAGVIQSEEGRIYGDLTGMVSDDFISLYVSLKTFRDKLDAGVSILLQAQMFLIFLLMILIVIALEDRNRQRVRIETSQRIQKEITRAQEEERNRIALDLHDDIAQELSWMRMNLAKENTEISHLEVFDKLISRIRDLSQSLRTPDFTSEFFDDAVRDLIITVENRSSIKVKYIPGNKNSVANPEIYGHLYRVIQECLTNAAKHAGSCRVFIELQEEDHSVFFAYRDDGRGFKSEGEGLEMGLGLKGIRNRVMMMNGKMDLITGQGKGLNIQCRIPLKSDNNG